MLPSFPDNPQIIHSLCRTILRQADACAVGEVSLTLYDICVLHSLICKGSRLDAHSHCELHLVLDGSMTYTVQRHTYTVLPGQFILHAPYIPHSWISEDSTLRYLCLSFDARPWQFIVNDCIHAELSAPFAGELTTLFEEAFRKRRYWKERLRLRLPLVFAHLFDLQHLEQTDIQRAGADQLVSVRVEKFLREHLAERITLDDIAASVGVSRRVLTRDFRLQMGCSVMERLHAMRIFKAQELLAASDLSLPEISQQVGFADLSYFCASFRKARMVSPRRYRMAQQA